MGSITQNIIFPKSGLDSDTAQEYIQAGDSEYRLHIMHGTDGSNGVVENMKGNHVSSYPLNLSNCYQVQGGYYDRLTRKVYYLIMSQPYDWSGSDDYIYDNHLLCFNEDTEEITNIFTDTKNYFGLGLNVVVKDWDMIGNYLYFNPRDSEPKMIDVVRAKNYMDYPDYDPLSTYVSSNTIKYSGGVFVANTTVAAEETPCTHTAKWDRKGDCYQDSSDINFDSEFRYAFNVIRHIPVYRPICAYGTDEDKNSNSVRGRVFRFTCKYKFFDDTESLWSAYSELTLPVYDEYYNGEVMGSPDLYNYIEVSVGLHSASLIKEVEIAFQEIGGDWKRAKVINRQEQTLLDTTTYKYKFYNTDSAYVVIDETEFEEMYDSVPLKADTQELINKNILAYGGCTLGYNNIPKNEIGVTLTPEIEAITIAEGVDAVVRDNMVSGDWNIKASGSTINLTIGIDNWFTVGALSAGDVYVINIFSKEVVYILQAADVLSATALGTNIATHLSTIFPTVTIYYGQVNGAPFKGVVFVHPYPFITRSLFYSPNGVSEVALTKKGGFKTGAWHPFCIYYYDKAMRRWDAQTSKENVDSTGYAIDGTTVYVPMLNETSPVPTDTANRWKINWSVNHLPPDDAVWWRWGYAGGGVTYFVQYVISTIDLVSTPWTKMNITPLQTIRTTTSGGWNQFPNSSIEPYEFVKGDRVRVITEAAAGGNLGLVYDGVLDFEIVKYEETTATPPVYYIYTQNFDITGLGAGTLVEIYRPRSTDTPTVYYEFGELMPIIEDLVGVRTHGCGATGTQNQDTLYGHAATGTFESGDVYHILRTPSYPISTVEGSFHESQWYSDFYTSNDWSKGRPGVETSFGQRKLNVIYFSNQYLQDTRINGLSTFEADNYKELNDIYGRIVGMVEVGNTLKVYMEKKCASVLIGRQEYIDTNEQTTVTTSERILGSVRYSESNFGCQFIESITKTNRFVYFGDAYNGVMCRDSANGVFPISGRHEEAGVPSDYKMESWFRDKFEALVKSGIEYTSVITVFDERYKCLYVCFKDLVNSENDETVVFHEPSNRWITLAEFTQMPNPSYNVMLELDWWVVSGFENGIGFEFDGDTRFAVFNISRTSKAQSAYPPLDGLTIESLAATVSITANPTIPLEGVTLLSLPPNIIYSYIAIPLTNFSWGATEYSFLVQDTTVLNCFPSPCILYSLVAYPGKWFDIYAGASNLDVNSQIPTGSVLYLYPTSENTGEHGRRTATVTFRSTYGDVKSITLEQLAPIASPNVLLFISGHEVNGMQLYNTSGSMVYGERQVTINFRADHPFYTTGQTFAMNWHCEIVTIGGGGTTLAGSGYFTCTDNTLMSTVVEITADASSNTNVIIYLYSTPMDHETVSGTIDSLSITSLRPDTICSAVASTVQGFSFLSTENSYAEAVALGHQTVITALPYVVTITSKPGWLTIWSDAHGYALYEGWTISNGETITMFPTNENTAFVPVPASGNDYVRLTTAWGDTTVISVNQASATPPPAQVQMTGTGSIHSDSTAYLSFPFSPSVYGLSLANKLTLSFIIKNALVSDGEFFTLYYRVDITRGGGTSSFGSGNFSAQNTDDYTVAMYANNTEIYLTGNILEGDSINVVFSLYSL